jgi:hypothetical protein
MIGDDMTGDANASRHTSIHILCIFCWNRLDQPGRLPAIVDEILL